MHRPKLYSSANDLQLRDAATVLARYRDVMTCSDDSEVLDVGCGNGDVTHELLLPALRRWRRLVATDVSPAMVNFAASKHQHPGLHFRCLDIAKVTQPREMFPNGFDKIFSFYCLHWVPEQRLALGNMFELLIPGGEMLLVFLASNPVFAIYERLAVVTAWSQYMQDAARFVSPYQHSSLPDSELLCHLEGAGFTVRDCECRHQTFLYPSRQAFKDLVKSVNPFLDRIPSELHEAYLTDFLTEAEDMDMIGVDGTVNMEYRLLVAFAKKP